MPNVLTKFQIEVLLHFLEADVERRTVTDAAKRFGKSKVSVTRALDQLEKMGIVERLPLRKTVLSPAGDLLARKYQQQLHVAESYMQYLDLPPIQAKENAMSMVSAGFSDQFLNRIKEQEERMRVKELFAGRQGFGGGELCQQLRDGNYSFPFVVYREHIKDGDNISMGNEGFEHPCQLVVKNRVGMIYLTVKTVRAPSAQNGIMMEGRIQRLQYREKNDYWDAEKQGRYLVFPAHALHFISMGSGWGSILHGSVCFKMRCSVGDLHMPESTAIFAMLIG